MPFEELKERQASVWGPGPYQGIDSGEAVWDLWSRDFGPTRMLAETLDRGRRDEFHRNFVELHERSRMNGGIHFSRTYLLTLGTRRP